MPDALIAQLLESGFFRYASTKDSRDLQTALADGNLWVIYDAERLKRFYPADAEDLAEIGIKRYLDEVSPYLRTQAVPEFTIEEDDGGGDWYTITIDGKVFTVWNEADIEHEFNHERVGLSWGKASYTTFCILNMLLENAASEERAYAYSGGNELGFIFMTPTQHALLMQFHKAKEHLEEMPYVMVDRYPDYGLPKRTKPKTPAEKTRRTFWQRYIAWLPVLIILACAKYYFHTIRHPEAASAGQRTNINQPAPTSIDSPTLAGMYTLSVASDFSVQRTMLTENPNMLTWVITENGRTVLERNAINETSYRYYRFQTGATYTIHLKAHINGAYHVVSNTVTLTP